MTFFNTDKGLLPTVLRNTIWTYVDPHRILPSIDLGGKKELDYSSLLNLCHEMRKKEFNLSNSLYAGLVLVERGNPFCRTHAVKDICQKFDKLRLFEKHRVKNDIIRSVTGAVYAIFQDNYRDEQRDYNKYILYIKLGVISNEDYLRGAIQRSSSLTLWLMRNMDPEAIKKYNQEFRGGKSSFAKELDRELKKRDLFDKNGELISWPEMKKLLQ